MPVRGDKQTARALRDLASYVATPLNTASRFALVPTRAAARRNVRALPLDDSTGALAASLTIKKKAKSSKLNPVHQVGPDSEFERNGRKPVKYAHLVEFGTAPHYQPERGVTHPGSKPMPFLTPAFYDTRDEVVKRFGQKIGPEMEKRARRIAAKGKPK
jgi:hypothetical protein